MKYPNKLYSVEESVIGKMVLLSEMIPNSGIGVEDLYFQVHENMDVSDYIDALSCMFFINELSLSNNNILYRNVKRNNL